MDGSALDAMDVVQWRRNMKGRSDRTGIKYTLSEWNAIEHIKLYSDSLQELVRLSGYMAREDKTVDEDFTFVYKALTDDICRGCPRFRSCAGELESEMGFEFNKIIDDVLNNLHSDNYDISPEFRKNCVYYHDLIEETVWLSRILYQNRYWRKFFSKLKHMLQREISSQEMMLRECAKQMESGSYMNWRVKRKLNWLLLGKRAVVHSGREHIGKDGSLEVLLEVRLFCALKASILSENLSNAYRRPMVCNWPEGWIPAGVQRIMFTEEGNFHVSFGISCCRKTGESVCGDTFSFVRRTQRQAVMCLSDGMGTGERAFEGSSRLIEAFETMMMAGILEETAMELLHTALYLQMGKELSTLDIASVSLRTGIVKLIKAGGAATFIRHRNEVERFKGDSLPLGCLEEGRVGCQYKKLYDGDMIIMLSDGMLSFEDMEGAAESVEAVLEKIETPNAQSFADQLMAAVPAVSDGHEDDRTVLVAALWERGHGNYVD